jgi:hypothetical protein
MIPKSQKNDFKQNKNQKLVHCFKAELNVNNKTERTELYNLDGFISVLFFALSVPTSLTFANVWLANLKMKFQS